jgi:hypothetical protein
MLMLDRRMLLRRLPLAVGRLAVDELTTSPGGGGVLPRRPHKRYAKKQPRSLIDDEIADTCGAGRWHTRSNARRI